MFFSFFCFQRIFKLMSFPQLLPQAAMVLGLLLSVGRIVEKASFAETALLSFCCSPSSSITAPTCPFNCSSNGEHGDISC